MQRVRTRRSVALAISAATLVWAPAGATATGVAKAGDATSSDRPAPRPAVPTTLPSAANSAHERAADWLVVAQPGARSDAIAARLGARIVAAPIGVYAAPEPIAARLVAQLRQAGRFRYAEPDVPLRGRVFPTDPLSPSQLWIAPLIAPDLTPPAAPAVPVVGIIESGIAVAHPELSAGNVSIIGPATPDDPHGTAVTSVASAPANGSGIVGFWPGAPTKVYADGDTCAGAVSAIVTAAVERIPVINMSYGVSLGCVSHYDATQFAFGLGTLPVAAAGNGFEVGSPPDRPSIDPHVLTVGALNPDLSLAAFTSRSDGLDLAAPGVQIPAAVPVPVDDDGTPDGIKAVDGTSFASPLVAAAAGWLRTARPDLSATQTFELLRMSARDIAEPGWDDRSGFGLLNLQAALATPEVFHDPNEPNDDIEWVDGRHFAKDRPILRGRASLAFFATLDYTEDPIDVVPVWVPGRSRLRVDAIPSGRSNVHLELFSATARTVHYRTKPKTLLAGSYRPGNAREVIRFDNPGRTPRIVYVETYVPGNAAFSDATYRLVLRRSALPRAPR